MICLGFLELEIFMGVQQMHFNHHLFPNFRIFQIIHLTSFTTLQQEWYNFKPDPMWMTGLKNEPFSLLKLQYDLSLSSNRCQNLKKFEDWQFEVFLLCYLLFKLIDSYLSCSFTFAFTLQTKCNLSLMF